MIAALALALAAPETSPPQWRPNMPPVTRAELIASCLAGGGGNPVAARQCRRTIADTLQMLYTGDSANQSHGNASPACLSAPALSGAAMIDRVMLAIQLEQDLPERASENAAVTVSALALALFPCGTRRF